MFEASVTVEHFLCWHSDFNGKYNFFFFTCNLGNETQSDEMTCTVSQKVSDSIRKKFWSSSSLGRAPLGSLCLHLTEFSLLSLDVVHRCYPRINLPDRSGIDVTFWILMNW